MVLFRNVYFGIGWLNFPLPHPKSCHLIVRMKCKDIVIVSLDVPRQNFLTLDTQQLKTRNANKSLLIVWKNKSTPLYMHYIEQKSVLMSNHVSEQFLCLYKL